MSYWYLASPYTHYEEGRQAAFEHISKVAGELFGQGIPIFCPIAHGHPMSIYGGMPPGEVGDKHWQMWIDSGKYFMEGAIGCIVSTMKGWEVSPGVLNEIAYFKKAGKPIMYLPYGQTANNMTIRNPEDDE